MKILCLGLGFEMPGGICVRTNGYVCYFKLQQSAVSQTIQPCGVFLRASCESYIKGQHLALCQCLCNDLIYGD